MVLGRAIWLTVKFILYVPLIYLIKLEERVLMLARLGCLLLGNLPTMDLLLQEEGIRSSR
jgi:hypothetical protein